MKKDYILYAKQSRVSFLMIYFWPSDQTCIVRVSRIHPITKIKYEEIVLGGYHPDHQAFAHEMLIMADAVYIDEFGGSQASIIAAQSATRCTKKMLIEYKARGHSLAWEGFHRVDAWLQRFSNGLFIDNSLPF